MNIPVYFRWREYDCPNLPHRTVGWKSENPNRVTGDVPPSMKREAGDVLSAFNKKTCD